MLTLSFIDNFAPKKIKPKTKDRKTKALTGTYYTVHLLPGSNVQARKHLHRKPCVQKTSTKKLYTEEIMSVSAVPNKVTRCVDNPTPYL